MPLFQLGTDEKVRMRSKQSLFTVICSPYIAFLCIIFFFDRNRDGHELVTRKQSLEASGCYFLAIEVKSYHEGDRNTKVNEIQLFMAIASMGFKKKKKNLSHQRLFYNLIKNYSRRAWRNIKYTLWSFPKIGIIIFSKLCTDFSWMSHLNIFSCS